MTSHPILGPHVLGEAIEGAVAACFEAIEVEGVEVDTADLTETIARDVERLLTGECRSG
ncbi:hypothetical protein [Streptomyces sp. NPDC051577]|uniref:hypothetical protein n=1 Tax=Streptomyces sp. NPDC051577 TaxID=3155166 RepID=UPI003432A6D7